jgi:hypothetical protein
MSLVRFHAFDAALHNRQTEAFDTLVSDQGDNLDGFYGSSSYYQEDLAFSVMNTGFGRSPYEHNFGNGSGGVSTLCFGMHLKTSRGTGGTFDGNSDFFQARHRDIMLTVTKQFALAIRADGRIELWSGGTGSNFTGTLRAATDPGVVEQDVYHWFEFVVTSPAGIQIYRDGSLILDEAGAQTVKGGIAPTTYTLAGFVWENFGFPMFVADNFYLRNDAVLMGEKRNTTNYPTDDDTIADIEVSNLTPVLHPSLTVLFAGLPTYAGMILERKNFPYTGCAYHDEDNSSLRVAAGDTGRGVFRFLRWFPVGTIDALSVTIAFRGATGSAGHRIRPIIRGSVDSYGDWYDFDGSNRYTIKQWIFTVDPENSDPWDEEDFSNQFWTFGFEIEGGSNVAYVSQLTVERMHEAGTGATADYAIGR